MSSDPRVTLSDDDVALLLEQAASDAADAAGTLRAAPRPRWLRAVDFTRPTKFSTEQETRVRRAHELFCRTASTRLAAEHRLEVELQLVDVSQFAYRDAHGLLRRDALAMTLEVAPMGTTMLLSVELALLRPAIARLLGAPTLGRDDGRKLTDIDLALVRRVFSALVAALSLTWRDLAGITLAGGRLDAHSDQAALVSPSEPTLAVTLQARVGATTTSVLLLVPYAAVSEVADRLSRRAHGEGGARPEDAEAARGTLSEVEVTVRAGLGARELALDDVLALHVGDVVRLGVHDASQITLSVDGEPVHAAAAGRFGSRRAALIRPLPEDDAP